MKILFLTHYYPNYVSDLLLHGLRKLMGPDAVDFPCKSCLFEGVLGTGVCPDNQRCDTSRFWENAACNSIHCCQRMPLNIPQTFSDSHIICFDHPVQMRKKPDSVLESVDNTRAMIATARYHLLNHHLSTHRAQYFIEKATQAFHS